MKSLTILVLWIGLATVAMAGETERNTEIAYQLHELINARDFDGLDEIIAPDVIRHSAATIGMQVRSLDDFKAFLRQDLVGVPDAQVEVDRIMAAGDMVAVRSIYRGTQTGPMGPFPPSGKAIELPYIGMLRFKDGKIVEMWVEWDNYSLLTELGHIPPPEEVE